MVDQAVRVASRDALYEALARVASPGRALAVIGGADLTDPNDAAALHAFTVTFADYLEATGTAVVDGGTDSGVMRLLGEVRAARPATFPLIGVAPEGVFERETRTGGSIAPAREHSLVVLVPGDAFGDEDDWLFDAADHLNGGPAPTLVVNGGRLTLDEANLRLGLGHPVIAVAGSGRAADELAGQPGLQASGRLRVVPISAGVAELAAAIEGGWDR